MSSSQRPNVIPSIIHPRGGAIAGVPSNLPTYDIGTSAILETRLIVDSPVSSGPTVTLPLSYFNAITYVSTAPSGHSDNINSTVTCQDAPQRQGNRVSFSPELDLNRPMESMNISGDNQRVPTEEDDRNDDLSCASNSNAQTHLDLQKAFRHIVKKPNPKKFSGENCKEYKLWKRNL